METCSHTHTHSVNNAICQGDFAPFGERRRVFFAEAQACEKPSVEIKGGEKSSEKERTKENQEARDLAKKEKESTMPKMRSIETKKTSVGSALLGELMRMNEGEGLSKGEAGKKTGDWAKWNPNVNNVKIEVKTTDASDKEETLIDKCNGLTFGKIGGTLDDLSKRYEHANIIVLKDGTAEISFSGKKKEREGEVTVTIEAAPSTQQKDEDSKAKGVGHPIWETLPTAPAVPATTPIEDKNGTVKTPVTLDEIKEMPALMQKGHILQEIPLPEPALAPSNSKAETIKQDATEMQDVLRKYQTILQKFGFTVETATGYRNRVIIKQNNKVIQNPSSESYPGSWTYKDATEKIKEITTPPTK